MNLLEIFCDDPTRDNFKTLAPEYKSLLVDISVEVLSAIVDNDLGWDLNTNGNWIYVKPYPEILPSAANWDVFLMTKIIRYNSLTDEIPPDVRRGYKSLLTGLLLLQNAETKLVLTVNFFSVGGFLEKQLVDLNGTTVINIEEELSIMQGQKSLMFNSYEEAKQYLADMFRTEHLNIDKMYIHPRGVNHEVKKLFYDKNIGIVFNTEASECLKCLQKIFKLGLGEYCTRDDCKSVKSKVRQCLKKYHPDKKSGSGGKLSKENEEKFHLATYILKNCKSVTEEDCQTEIKNAPETWKSEDIEDLWHS